MWSGVLAEVEELEKNSKNLSPNDASKLEGLNKIVAEYGATGWVPPRFEKANNLETAKSGAGEDFLYMHRMMLQDLNTYLVSEGLPKAPTWKTLPAVNSPQFPVAPIGTPQNQLERFKTDWFYQNLQTVWEVAYKSPEVDYAKLVDVLQKSRAQLKGAKTLSDEEAMTRVQKILNPCQSQNVSETDKEETGSENTASQINCKDKPLVFKGLKGISLSEYGYILETPIHASLHGRYNPYLSPQRPATVDPLDRVNWNESYATLYDSNMYDNLDDAYASHVHPWFYRIHGWIDDRIQDWLAAQDEKYKSIGTADECKKLAQPCYVWLSHKDYIVVDNNRTPWQGPNVAHGDHLPSEQLPNFGLRAKKSPNIFSPEVIKATRGMRAPYESMSRTFGKPAKSK